MDNHPQAKYWEPRLEATALRSLACYSPLLCRSNRKCLAPPWQRVHRPLQQPRRYQPCWNVNTLRSWMYLNGSTLLLLLFFWTIIYLNETKSSTDTHRAQHKLKGCIKLLDSYFDWRKESMLLLFKEDCSLTSRLRGLYRPWIVRKVANGLQMLHSIFDQVLEVIQFTVICHYYKPFKADSWPFDVKTCPLANIWVYGQHC